MTPPEPTSQHQWLQQLVGEWTMTGTVEMGPDTPTHESTHESTGKETVYSLGGLWFVCEGEGCIPDGAPGQMRMTLGYDTTKQKFVGSWVGSMMTNMWVYEGELDDTGKILTLNTEGPGFEEGTIGKYRDVIEFKSNDQRILTSHALGADGAWNQFMQADYRRVK